MLARVHTNIKLLVLLGCSLLLGCARTPRVPTVVAPKRQLIVEFALPAPASPNYFYFVAFDNDGDPANGPVPVTAWSDAMGSGWGIISQRNVRVPAYVVYNQGRFSQYLNDQYKGPPFQAQVLDGGRRIRLTLDLDLITTSVSLLSMNIITVDTEFPPSPPGVRVDYDGLGPFPGNDYVSFPLANSTLRNLGDETEGDCPEPTLDIVDWSAEVRISP